LGNAAGAGAGDAPLRRNRSCQAHQAARDKRDGAAVTKPIIALALGQSKPSPFDREKVSPYPFGLLARLSGTFVV